MKQDYDVVVIGAGVGGLTAGAYLAQAGLKVIIVERHTKVGGYCGSFNRDGFLFDEAVHYINHMGPGGPLRKIYEELGLEKYVEVIAIDPSDRLMMPGMEIAIYHDWRRTVSDLSELFWEDRHSIRKFFQMVTSFEPVILYSKYKERTFRQLLDSLFRNRQLKTALSLFATTMGLDADKLSALGALAYYKGSILDGGYHPRGGAQKFSNGLSKRFQDFGGQLILGTGVKRIIISSNKVSGVELEDGATLSTKSVISNADATHTFEDLVGESHVGLEFVDRIRSLRPSLSLLVVYLGLSTSLEGKVPDCCNLWYFPFGDIGSSSMDIVKDCREAGIVHVGLSSLHDRSMAPQGCESLVLFCGASYNSQDYWEGAKKRLARVLVERACQAIPQIRNNIRLELSASPYTLFRYTLNRAGAYRGWEITPDQAQWELVQHKCSIGGLYLAGHWITTPVGNGGVSAVALSGKRVSQMILRTGNRSSVVV